MKMCNTCKLNKPLLLFPKRTTGSKDGRRGQCTECRQAYNRDQYQTNPVARAQKIASVTAYKASYHKWYDQLKSGPCIDCELKFHFAAMQWDHVGTDKSFNVSQALAKGYGKQRVLDEIAKCELVCANCHAIRTYRRNHES